MLTAIIIEDEELARENLKLLLAEFCPNVNVVAAADNIEDGVKAINQFLPEAVAQTGAFPRGAQDEQSADAALEQVFDEPFQAGFVKLIATAQRRDHGWNNSGKWCGQGHGGTKSALGFAFGF